MAGNKILSGIKMLQRLGDNQQMCMVQYKKDLKVNDFIFLFQEFIQLFEEGKMLRY